MSRWTASISRTTSSVPTTWISCRTCCCSIRWLKSPCHLPDRKSTRLNSSHLGISYAVFFLKKIAEVRGGLREESTKTDAERRISLDLDTLAVFDFFKMIGAARANQLFPNTAAFPS